MATNTNNIEDEVRRRAYELWEQYGRPESGEKEFWLKAEREIKQAKGLNGTAPESSKTTSEGNRQEQAPPAKPTGGVNLPGAGSATSTNAISFDFTTTNPLLSGAGLPSATTRAAGPTADLDEIGNVGVEGHVHRAGESGHDLAARNSGTSGATRMVDLGC